MNFLKSSVNREIIWQKKKKKLMDEEVKNLKSENTTFCLTVNAEICELRFKY